MKVLNIAFVILFSFVFSITAFANTATAGYSRADMFSKIKEAIKNPTKAKKFVNPYGLAGNLAFEGLMQGIDKLSEQAQNPTWQNEKYNEHSTKRDKTQLDSTYEYALSDNETFSSADEFRQYLLDTRLKKDGLKRTRDNDGLMRDSFTVDYANKRIIVTIHVGYLNQHYPNNVGGFYHTYTGRILKVGTISNTTVVNDRERTKDIAVNQVINDYLDKYENDLEKEGVKVGATTPTNTAENTETGSNVKPRPTTDTAEEASDTHTDAKVSDKNKENDKVIDNAQTKDKTKETAKEKDKEQEKKDKEKEKELPDFCDWAKSVCDFMEWVKREPELSEQDQDISEKDIPIKTPVEFDKDYVRANAQCPDDVVVPLDMGFATHELVFSFNPICDFVRIYLSKVVLFIAYLFATLHISSAFKV